MSSQEPDSGKSDAMSTDAAGSTAQEAAAGPDAAGTGAAGGVAESVMQDAVTRARPTPVARLYEEEQRIDGRFRWSVGGAQRSCRGCKERIPPHTSFSTALVAANAEDLPGVAGPDPTEVFERCDYCRECFDQLPHERVFAHWNTCFPAPEAAPKKQVNLASLRSYFDQVAELIRDPEGEKHDAEKQAEEAAHADDPSFEAHEAAAEHHAGEPHAELEHEPHEHPPESDDPQTSGAFAYLLALFLVRRRLLKWRGFTDGGLTLECRQTQREYLVQVPHGDERALTAQVLAFEELFQ